MNAADFDLCNQAHRALASDLRRRLAGYASGDTIDQMALAMLDFDGEPLDANGSWEMGLPDHLRPLAEQRADVRAWAPAAPPRSRVVFMEVTL